MLRISKSLAFSNANNAFDAEQENWQLELKATQYSDVTARRAPTIIMHPTPKITATVNDRREITQFINR
jgi:hypothetical protein